MKEITLTQGKVAIVDDEDYPSLIQYHWYAKRNKNHFYAERTFKKDGRWQCIQMHKQLLGEDIPSGTLRDHRNRNSLDNRRENLRVVTPSVNTHNSIPMRNNQSGYRGVCWHKKTRKWSAYIKIGGKQYYGGEFVSISEAVMARDELAKSYYGDSAVLNQP
jgi:hypothetical protein